MGIKTDNVPDRDEEPTTDLGIPQDDKVKIDLEEPEDTDEGGDSEQESGEREERAARGGQPRDKTGKWAEKKRERREQFDWKREKAAYDQKIETIQRENARQIAELTSRMSQPQFGFGGPAGQQPQDPHVAKLIDLDKQLASELKLLEADANRGYERYNELQTAKQEAIFDRKLAAHQAQQQSQRPAQDPYAMRRELIGSEFPWTTNPQFRELAIKGQQYKQYLVGVEGKPDTLDTDREALAHIQARFGAQYGLQPPPAAPSPRTRALYETPGSRTAPSRRPAEGEIELPREMVEASGLSAAQLRRAINERG